MLQAEEVKSRLKSVYKKRCTEICFDIKSDTNVINKKKKVEFDPFFIENIKDGIQLEDIVVKHMKYESSPKHKTVVCMPVTKDNNFHKWKGNLF